MAMSEVKEPPPKPSRIRTASSHSAKSTSLAAPAPTTVATGQHSPVAKLPMVLPRPPAPKIPAKTAYINSIAASSEQPGINAIEDTTALDATVKGNSAHQASRDPVVPFKTPAPLPGHGNINIPASATSTSHDITHRATSAPAPPPKPKRISLAPRPNAKPLSLQVLPHQTKVEAPVCSTTLPATVPLTSTTSTSTSTTATTVETSSSLPFATPNSTPHVNTSSQALASHSGSLVSSSSPTQPYSQPPVKKPRSAEHSIADESVSAQQRFRNQLRVQPSSPPPSMSMSNPNIGSKSMTAPSTPEKRIESTGATSPVTGTNPTLIGARSRLRSTSDAKASASLAVSVPLHHSTKNLATSYSDATSFLDQDNNNGFNYNKDNRGYGGALVSPTFPPSSRLQLNGTTAAVATYDNDYLEDGSSGGRGGGGGGPTSEKLAASLHKIQALAHGQSERMKQINYSEKRADIAEVVYEKSSIWRARGAEWGGLAKKAWEDRGGMGGIAGGIADRWKKRGDGMHDGMSEYPRPGVSAIFGIPLEEAVRVSKISASTGVPAIVTRCIEYLDIMGVEEVGLYRVSGSTSNVARLKAMFDGGHDFDFLQKGNEPQNPHDVATLLKLYLRELPSPIIPTESMPIFNNVDFSNPNHAPIQQLKEALHELPLENYILLGTLCHHLSNLADYENCTKMNISNLGLIFCPTLQIGSVLFKNLLGGDGSGNGGNGGNGGGDEERRKSLLAVWSELDQRHEEMENLEMIKDFEMNMQFEKNGDRAYLDESARERDYEKEQQRIREMMAGRPSWEEVDRDLLDFSPPSSLPQAPTANTITTTTTNSSYHSPFSSTHSHAKANHGGGGGGVPVSTTQNKNPPLDLYDELMTKELNEATNTPLIDFGDDDDDDDDIDVDANDANNDDHDLQQQRDKLGHSQWRRHAREPATNQRLENPPPRGVVTRHERIPAVSIRF